jgi:uncharacterized protein (TIGR00251 family)
MLRASKDGVTLAVRVQPGARKSAIVDVYGEGASAQLKIAVNAPPVEGRANTALIEFLAEFFSLSKSAIELATGASSRSKVFLLRGISLAQAEAIIKTAVAR